MDYRLPVRHPREEKGGLRGKIRGKRGASKKEKLVLPYKRDSRRTSIGWEGAHMQRKQVGRHTGRPAFPRKSNQGTP